MNILEWLENWYASQCDGDWEHGYGIKIDTLDNPGWSLKVDLIDTNVNTSNISSTLIELSEYKWVSYSVDDCCFIAHGGAYDLNILIHVFKLLVDNGKIDENKVREYIKDRIPDKFK